MLAVAIMLPCRRSLDWGTRLLLGLRKADKPNYFDKICAALLAVLAGSQLLAGKDEEARGTLIRAKELAAFFDASPSYDETDIRFVTRIEGTSAHDDLGTTAMDGVCKAISQFENEELTALWKSLTEQETKYAAYRAAVSQNPKSADS